MHVLCTTEVLDSASTITQELGINKYRDCGRTLVCPPFERSFSWFIPPPVNSRQRHKSCFPSGRSLCSHYKLTPVERSRQTASVFPIPHFHTLNHRRFKSRRFFLAETMSDNDKGDGTSFATALVAGGLAGTSVDVMLFPIDTLKTRMQSPQGFLKAGGFRGIYNGLGAAAVGSAPGGRYS